MVKNRKVDAILRWIHLVAIASGVGGVSFVVLVLFPSMPAVTDEGLRNALAGAVFGRFGPIAWTVMATITLTGVGMVVNRWPLSLKATYTWVLIAKLVLVTVWASTNALVLLGFFDPSALRFSMVMGMVIILFGASLATLPARPGLG